MLKMLAAVVAVGYISMAPSALPDALDAELKPGTVAGFDTYVRLAETAMDDDIRKGDRFLSLDTRGEADRLRIDQALRRGEVVIEPLQVRDGAKAVVIPHGLVHHWVGMAYVAGVGVDDAVKLLQDYDHHAEIYQPAVQRSKILSRDGDHFHVFLRFYQKKVIAVTLNSEHDAEFVRAGEGRVYSRIHSTRIAEVADAGTPSEHERPVGQDGGYLWRLNTYWRFVERDGGTYIQCESITLTRDIPLGFGWVVKPFVTGIPRESLTFTMERTRKALTKP